VKLKEQEQSFAAELEAAGFEVVYPDEGSPGTHGR
jgi:hypothetical protein